MFRYKCSIPVSYPRQGYIYFTSLLYRELPKNRQEKIRELCRQAGGGYWKALMEFVTTNAGAESVCARHYLSRSTLARVVRRYYEIFPDEL